MPAAIAVTVEGVAQTTLQPGWSINATINGRDSFRGDILSLDASNRPALDDEIVIVAPTYADPNTTERIFGGIITSTTERGFGGVGASTGIVTQVSATDYNALADRRLVYGTRPAETLKARLTWLVATYLAAYSVTLHASQADGDTLPLRDYNYEKLANVFDELSTLTQWLWEINYSKVLRMAAAGATAAPFDLTQTLGVVAHVVGDIEVTPTRDNFANVAIVRYNGSTEHTDTLVATEVVSLPDEPGQTEFFLHYIHDTNPGYLTVDGTPNIDMASNGWTVAASTASPSGWSLLTTTPQAEGTTILFTYSSKFAGVEIARDAVAITSSSVASPTHIITPAPHGLVTTDTASIEGHSAPDVNGLHVVTRISDTEFTIPVGVGTGGTGGTVMNAGLICEVVIDAQNVFSTAGAAALAAQYLAQRKQVRKSTRYPTNDWGLFPGMAQTQTTAKRALSAAFLITDVDRQHIANQLVRHTITAIEGAVVLSGSWRDTWKQIMSGGGSSGSGLVTVSVPSSSGSPGGGRMVYQLTGEGITAVQSPTPTWVAACAARIRIDSARFGTSGTVYIRRKTGNAGITVAARLYNVTTSAVAGSCVAITPGTTYGDAVPFAVTIAAGANDYELQVNPGTAAEDVFAFAWLES